MRAAAVFVLVVLAGCSAPSLQGPSPTPKPWIADKDTVCPLASADYLLGATFVHVTSQDEPNAEPVNARNRTVELERGGSETQRGAPMDRQATDSRGCASFFLTENGTYRFETPGACAPVVSVLHWNRTFMDQVELTIVNCE